MIFSLFEFCRFGSFELHPVGFGAIAIAKYVRSIGSKSRFAIAAAAATNKCIIPMQRRQLSTECRESRQQLLEEELQLHDKSELLAVREYLSEVQKGLSQQGRELHIERHQRNE